MLDLLICARGMLVVVVVNMSVSVFLVFISLCIGVQIKCVNVDENRQHCYKINRLKNTTKMV